MLLLFRQIHKGRRLGCLRRWRGEAEEEKSKKVMERINGFLPKVLGLEKELGSRSVKAPDPVE